MRLFDLTGRVALVTGGNGGIGLAIAQGLAEAGARVVIAGRDRDKSAEALQSLPADASSVVVDIADPASCRAMVADVTAQTGRLDILVNNAGINIRKQPQDFIPDEWREVLDVNLSGSFFAAQAAYPALKASTRGKVINVGSMMSIFAASFAAPYAASKGGVVQMTKALACAWAPDGIGVNAILPGWIDTDLTRRARRDVDGLHDRVLARTPAGRWGEPADLAGLAVFLASPASDFVTGTAIPADGGYAAQG